MPTNDKLTNDELSDLLFGMGVGIAVGGFMEFYLATYFCAFAMLFLSAILPDGDHK